MTEYIKNRSGKIIGRIEEKYVYDRSGKQLGWYNTSENRTYTREGRYIGSGDLRTSLLKEWD